MDSGNRQVDPDGGRTEPIAAKPPDVGFLAKAIDAAGLGILAFDRATGDVLYVNPRGSETLRSLSDASRIDALATVTRAVLAQAEVVERGPDDEPRSLAFGDRVLGFSLYPTPDVLWAFFRDVTEKVRLNTVAESLQLSDSLLGIFTALRHELGNSVNVVKTSLHVLRQGLGRHDEDAVRRYVDRSLEALSRVESVLGTLRDYGFAPRPRPRPVPVSEVVERAVLECGRCLVERGTALDVEMAEGETRIVADPASLEQALCDLVGRAGEKARAGKGLRVVVRVENRRDTVVIRVSPGGEDVEAPLHAEEDDLRLLVARRLVSQMEGTLELDGGDSVVTLRRAKGHE